MIARNIAPGIHRKFASEEWERIGKDLWKKARVEAYQAINYDVMPEIYGSDIDPDAIELAKANAEKAGVDDCITFEVKPCQEIVLPGKYGVMITNPPYGERIGELKEVENMYRALGGIMKENPTSVSYTHLRTSAFKISTFCFIPTGISLTFALGSTCRLYFFAYSSVISTAFL